MNSTFFPMGEQFVEALADYIAHVSEDRMFGPEDALFPKKDVTRGAKGFEVAALSWLPFASIGPLNEIVKEAFAAVGKRSSLSVGQALLG